MNDKPVEDYRFFFFFFTFVIVHVQQRVRVHVLREKSLIRKKNYDHMAFAFFLVS